MTRFNKDSKKIGIFCLKSKGADIRLEIPDGTYQNLIDDSEITVSDGVLRTDGKPIIFTVQRKEA